eukprot:TRINITY_DN12911_c0_g3_i2.p1 TRINITY_DN12911_c0_g3~~TRINITY_DN12911_c0_g3_i2.p1  ORF type:complete len:806 (+),score=173.53 TRINITY_DN12911_c0_g3_i2:60-2477(+)
MAAEVAPPVGADTGGERRERRRAGALLAAYYGLDSGEGGASTSSTAPATAAVDLDQKSFDAKAYFDGLLVSERTSQLLRRATSIDKEVRDMDSDLQMVAYENYNKLIRATDVTKKVKTSVEGFAPSLLLVDESVQRMAGKQADIEDATADRAQEMNVLLQRQRVCGKIKILFDLPRTMRKCLERGQYKRAVEAYCACTPFLRQYSHIAAFRGVLDEVDQQLGLVRDALEQRLRSIELEPDEAGKIAATLLDLGKCRDWVLQEYLKGRSAALRLSLDRCFAPDDVTVGNAVVSCTDEPGSGATLSFRLRTVCDAVTEQWVPSLGSAVEGLQMLHRSGVDVGGKPLEDEDATLSDFVIERVEDVFERFAAQVSRDRPEAEVIAGCVHSLKESLRRLHSLMPRLLTRLFTAFLGRVASNFVRQVYDEAREAFANAVAHLHDACQRRRDVEDTSSGAATAAEATLEDVATTERSLWACASAALDDCGPITKMVSTDKAACLQLVREVQRQLESYFGMLPSVCRCYAQPVGAACAQEDMSVPTRLIGLEKESCFSLALFGLARRVDEKALGRAWGDAVQRMSAISGALMEELAPRQLVLEGAQAAAEVALGSYVAEAGARVASILRDAVQRRRGLRNGLHGYVGADEEEPRMPSALVERCLASFRVLDMQLQRMLQDPRRARGQRRVFGRKNEMEMEMERLWARKLHIFAPVASSRAGAMLATLRIAFKALCEIVREETFTRVGLQQVQFDCALLSGVIADYVDGEDVGVLDSLLGEAVKSASQRCLEPVLVESDVVERLCDEKRRTLDI